MRLRALVVAVLVLVLGAWTCAPTGSGGGDVPISTTGLTALVSGEDWHYVGEAGEPAFQNSWANLGSSNKLAFRIREAGVVDVQGIITPGTLGATIFTLPDGYRPTSSSSSFFPITGVTAAPAYIAGRLVVAPSGAVTSSTLGTPTTLHVAGQFFLNQPT